MILEIDQAAVPPGATVEEMKSLLDGVVLDFHAFGGAEQADWEVKTLRELHDLGVVTHVTLHCR
jgi:hypothetical protein